MDALELERMGFRRSTGQHPDLENFRDSRLRYEVLMDWRDGRGQRPYILAANIRGVEQMLDFALVWWRKVGPRHYEAVMRGGTVCDLQVVDYRRKG